MMERVCTSHVQPNGEKYWRLKFRYQDNERVLKNAELAAELEEFADRHRQAVWDDVLTPIREAKGDPNWRPKGMMEGLGYQARVSKVLQQRFVAQLRAK